MKSRSRKPSRSIRIPWSVLAALALGFLPLAAAAGDAARKDPGPFEVAAFYFPGYHPTPRNDARLGKGWTEWELLKAARPRFPGHAQPLVPAWGHEDESDPAAMEKKIAAAADHGVTAFIFDWYWHEEGPFLDGALERGFLRAANRDRLKFCVMWANHDWIDIFPARAGVPPKLLYRGAVSRATFDRAADHAIAAYFSRPNHWKIDGRPVFSIYELMTLVKGLGGMERAREALDDFRRRVRAAGFPGLHLNAVAWGIQPAGLAPGAAEMVRALGVDSVTSYCWIHHLAPESFPSSPYPGWARRSAERWPEFRRQWPVPYFPNVSAGWDASPRTAQDGEFRAVGYPYTPVLTGNTPEEFRKALERARRFLEEDPAGPRVVTINAWNEWTEGSYLEPDGATGLGRLEAVRSVFGGGARAAAASPAAEEGFVPLFDGKTLRGWTIDCLPRDRERAAKAWTVDRGTLLADTLGSKDHFYILLSTEKEYGDFTLRLRFQVERNVRGNSGIQIRSRYDARTGWMEGPQIDIDPPNPQGTTGKLWNEGPGQHRWLSNEPVQGIKFFYADQGDGWNDLEITARGIKIRTALNGVKLVDYDGSGVLDDKEHKDRGVGTRGVIGLQIHSGDELKLRFKGLRIKEL